MLGSAVEYRRFARDRLNPCLLDEPSSSIAGMLRGAITADDFKGQFSGHETFPLN